MRYVGVAAILLMLFKEPNKYRASILVFGPRAPWERIAPPTLFSVVVFHLLTLSTEPCAG